MPTQGPFPPAAAANDATVGTRTWLNLPAAVQAQDNKTASPSGGISPQTVMQYIRCEQFPFSVPEDAGPVSVAFRVRRRKISATGVVEDYSVRPVIGGVIQPTELAVAGAWPMAETDATYTVSGLTPAQVNDAGFGLAFSCKNTAAGPVGENPNTVVPGVQVIDAAASW